MTGNIFVILKHFNLLFVYFLVLRRHYISYYSTLDVEKFVYLEKRTLSFKCYIPQYEWKPTQLPVWLHLSIKRRLSACTNVKGYRQPRLASTRICRSWTLIPFEAGFVVQKSSVQVRRMVLDKTPTCGVVNPRCQVVVH